MLYVIILKVCKKKSNHKGIKLLFSSREIIRLAQHKKLNNDEFIACAKE